MTLETVRNSRRRGVEECSDKESGRTAVSPPPRKITENSSSSERSFTEKSESPRYPEGNGEPSDIMGGSSNRTSSRQRRSLSPEGFALSSEPGQSSAGTSGRLDTKGCRKNGSTRRKSPHGERWVIFFAAHRVPYQRLPGLHGKKMAARRSLNRLGFFEMIGFRKYALPQQLLCKSVVWDVRAVVRLVFVQHAGAVISLC